MTSRCQISPFPSIGTLVSFFHVVRTRCTFLIVTYSSILHCLCTVLFNVGMAIYLCMLEMLYGCMGHYTLMYVFLSQFFWILRKKSEWFSCSPFLCRLFICLLYLCDYGKREVQKSISYYIYIGKAIVASLWNTSTTLKYMYSTGCTSKRAPGSVDPQETCFLISYTYGDIQKQTYARSC